MPSPSPSPAPDPLDPDGRGAGGGLNTAVDPAPVPRVAAPRRPSSAAADEADRDPVRDLSRPRRLRGAGPHAVRLRPREADGAGRGRGRGGNSRHPRRGRADAPERPAQVREGGGVAGIRPGQGSEGTVWRGRGPPEVRGAGGGEGRRRRGGGGIKEGREIPPPRREENDVSQVCRFGGHVRDEDGPPTSRCGPGERRW